MNKSNYDLKALPKKAKWIKDPGFDGASVSRFFRDFNVGAGLTFAKLSITACGFFQSYLNGKPTDTEYFKPVYTDFEQRKDLRLAHEFNGGRKKITCYTYDVTALLKSGVNRLDVLLGTGYYCNTEKEQADPLYAGFSFGNPKLLYELVLEYGSKVEFVKSDEDSFVRTENRKSLLFGGDYIDFAAPPRETARAEIAFYTGELVKPQAPADTVRQEFTCGLPVKTHAGGSLYDFGVNHSGGLCLRIRGAKGTRVTIYYAEILNEDGSINVMTGGWTGVQADGTPSAIYQKDELILSGGIDELSPLFCFHCYRYAEIYSDAPVNILSIKSLFICSPVVRSGEYFLGGGDLDRFSEIYAHTQLCSYHCGVPMDCPHREKLPYTADGYLTLESALYLFDVEDFYSKWLDDILEAQGASGFVPYTAPYLGGGGGYAWGNAIAEVPIRLYRHTGDLSYIIRALPGVLKWLKYYQERSGPDGAVHGAEETWLLGDWLSPEYNKFDRVFMSTLCHFRAVSLAEEMCAAVGDSVSQALLYRKKRVLQRQINDAFYDPVRHNYMSGRQGENIVPVAFGIPEEKQLPFILENIRRLYEDELGCHFDTGIIATPLLLEVLTMYGMKDLAFSIMTQTKYPSIFNMIQGETTLPENWGNTFPAVDFGNGIITNSGGYVSHCHPMFGSVAAWIYKHIAGIDLSRQYLREIIYAPKFYNQVTKASAKKRLKTGMAAISYQNNAGFHAEITVPPEYTGIFLFEKCERLKLPEGTWRIEIKPREALMCGNVTEEFSCTIVEF